MGSQFFESLEKGLAAVNKVCAAIGAILVLGLMVCVNTDLFLRFFFRSPVVGMTEITEIFLLYITFLGTSWVYQQDGHVVVDLLLYELYEKSRRVLILVNHVFVGLIALILVYFGTLTTVDHLQRGIRNPTILETPIALVIAIIPVGSAILLLEVVIKIRKTLKK
jgi:TRAP-type C4-dicarboxylate transport system permease small subunit